MKLNAEIALWDCTLSWCSNHDLYLNYYSKMTPDSDKPCIDCVNPDIRRLNNLKPVNLLPLFIDCRDGSRDSAMDSELSYSYQLSWQLCEEHCNKNPLCTLWSYSKISTRCVVRTTRVNTKGDKSTMKKETQGLIFLDFGIVPQI